MISSSIVMPQSYEPLRCALASLLVGKQHELQLASNAPTPLLLLITAEDVYGFVILTANCSKDAYASAYECFKRQYRDHHGDWQRKTLSFVICRDGRATSQDALFNSIEADIYFCRKYVVLLGSTAEEMTTNLLRLPILPIGKQDLQGIARPPSAQTLLQRANIPRIWAERIVRSGQYSAASFVADVLTEAFTVSSKLTLTTGSEARVSESPVARKRLTNIEISAFRAYKTLAKFDLDADVVVLYGQNGLGKTSFFDAIDFACTGRIGRLQGGGTSAKRLAEIARHLDASERETFVVLQTGDGPDSKLVRHVSDWDSACVGSEVRDRKSALTWLTAASWSEEVPRIENLERLFRATHLFSQNSQELLQKFLDSSILPYDLVTRMFSLEDYASGIKKTDEVLSLLDDRIKALSTELPTTRSQREESEQELRALRHEATGPVASSAVQQLASEVKERLARVLREPPQHDLGDQAGLRDQRVILTGAIENTRARISQTQTLSRKWPEIHAIRAEVVSMMSKTVSFKARRLDLARRKIEMDESIVRMKAESGRKSDVMAANAREMTALQAFIAAKKELLVLDSRKADATARKEQCTGRRSQFEKQSVALVQSIRETTARRDEQRRLLTSHESQLGIYRQLLAGVPKWHVDLKSLTSVQSQVEQRQNRFRILEQELQEKKDALQKTTADLATGEADLAKVSEGHTTVIRLLDDLEKFVSGPACPTCGHKHRSKGELLQRIQTQKATRPIELQAKADLCQSLAKVASELQGNVQQLTVRQTHETVALQQLRKHAEELDWAVSAFQQRLKDCGLSFHGAEVEAPLRHAEAATAHAVAEAQKQAEVSEHELAQAVDRKRVINQQITDAVEDISTCERECREISSAIDTVRLRITQLPIGVGIVDETVSKRMVELQGLADNLGQEFRGVQKAVGEAEATFQRVRRDLDAVVAELETTEQSLAKHENVIAAYEMDLVALGLPATSEADAITQCGTELESHRAEMLAILDKLHFLETAIDANARSVRVSELKQRIAVATDATNRIESEIAKLKRGRNSFRDLRELLDNERRSAVNRYIAAYGPLASVIQRRLRSVYGFDDIMLSERSGAVHVEVRRGETWKKPTDYFSDSQTQILMLSLFLAGRLTQTWSGFAPILLDDPVTHFDDLNAYSFVELIRGLVDDQPGTHQFIISTCEDRLFSLMRNKLAYLGDRAIFYQFTSIGSNGPEFERVGGEAVGTTKGGHGKDTE